MAQLLFFHSGHDEEEDDEDMSFQLADQEEEDLNRIKEESRRRRQAILEKYKCQQSDKKVEPSLKEPEKGNFQFNLEFRKFCIYLDYIYFQLRNYDQLAEHPIRMDLSLPTFYPWT